MFYVANTRVTSYSKLSISCPKTCSSVTVTFSFKFWIILKTKQLFCTSFCFLIVSQRNKRMMQTGVLIYLRIQINETFCMCIYFHIYCVDTFSIFFILLLSVLYDFLKTILNVNKLLIIRTEKKTPNNLHIHWCNFDSSAQRFKCLQILNHDTYLPGRLPQGATLHKYGAGISQGLAYDRKKICFDKRRELGWNIRSKCVNDAPHEYNFAEAEMFLPVENKYFVSCEWIECTMRRCFT